MKSHPDLLCLGSLVSQVKFEYITCPDSDTKSVLMSTLSLTRKCLNILPAHDAVVHSGGTGLPMTGLKTDLKREGERDNKRERYK